MNSVSDNAAQLYQFMVYHRSTFTTEKEGKHEVYCIFEPSEGSFTTSYKVYLDELYNASWIRKDFGKIILGHYSLQLNLYGEEGKLEDLISSYLGRYTVSESKTVLELFKSFAAKKGRQELTQLQALGELEYYAKFPCKAVLSSIRTYFSLSPEKQYGTQYFRGILRRETENNGIGMISVAPIHKQQIAVSPPSKFIPEYDQSLQQAEYLNERVTTYGSQEFLSLSAQQQQDLIQQWTNEFNS